MSQKMRQEGLVEGPEEMPSHPQGEALLNPGQPQSIGH